MIRRGIRRRQLDRLLTSACRLETSRLERPTLVLAPHPDDETLGCGGLVALLTERGTPVSIVFMTDGAGSHQEVSPADLADTRRREAIAASVSLGVPESSLHFLGYRDGGLDAAQTIATEQVVTLLSDLRPDQLVLPHAFEPNADHSATFRIAERAVCQGGRGIDGLRYAVWFWDQWPLTNPLAAPRGRHGRRAMIQVARRGRLGFGLSRVLTHVLDIGSVADRKREALAAHASQMSRPPNRPDWLTLSDVAYGEWLELLIQSHEYYSPVRLG